MVQHPGDYPWSSYGANEQGSASSLLTPDPLYLALGVDQEQCLRGPPLFDDPLSEFIVEERIGNLGRPGSTAHAQATEIADRS